MNQSRAGAWALVLFVVGFAAAAMGQTVATEPPAEPATDARYIFYLHGTWVEKRGQDTPHPRYGVAYDYDGILETLAGKGFVVIGESRPEDSDSTDYGENVAAAVESLIQKGVPPENITVAGHSKGAIITMVAARALANPMINYGIFGGCLSADEKFGRAYEKFMRGFENPVPGRFLSLVDVDDDVAESCAATFARFGAENTHEKILDTGEGHHLFYAPTPVWIDPLVAFAKGH